MAHCLVFEPCLAIPIWVAKLAPLLKFDSDDGNTGP